MVNVKMSTNTSPSLKKLKEGTYVASGRVCAPLGLLRNDAEDGHITPAEPKHQDFIGKVYNVKKTLYSNQTGQFTKISSCGKKYQMCLHELDSNTTWVEPMTSRTKQSMIAAWENVISRM